MYTPEALDHFMKPRNPGRLADPNGRGEATNHACGDSAEITVRIVGDEVAAAGFVSASCAGGIACCSAATEWVIGKPVGDALALDAATLSRLLGGLPEAKMGCAEMATEALRAALEQAR